MTKSMPISGGSRPHELQKKILQHDYFWVIFYFFFIVSGDKYESISHANGYKVHMQLKIKNVGPKDFMDYICMAKNSLGGSDGKITLYGNNQFADKKPKGHFSPAKVTYFNLTILISNG